MSTRSGKARFARLVQEARRDSRHLEGGPVMTSRQQRVACFMLAEARLGLSARLAAVVSLLTLVACQTPPVNPNPVPVDEGVSRTTVLSQSNVERGGQSLLDVSIVLFQHDTDALTESENRLHNCLLYTSPSPRDS